MNTCLWNCHGTSVWLLGEGAYDNVCYWHSEFKDVTHWSHKTDSNICCHSVFLGRTSLVFKVIFGRSLSLPTSASISVSKDACQRHLVPLSASIFLNVFTTPATVSSLGDLKRKPCNFLWFNRLIYVWGIYILIMSAVPRRFHWLTLSLDDILWTHHEWMQMTGTGPAPWTFAGLN